METIGQQDVISRKFKGVEIISDSGPRRSKSKAEKKKVSVNMDKIKKKYGSSSDKKAVKKKGGGPGRAAKKAAAKKRTRSKRVKVVLIRNKRKNVDGSSSLGDRAVILSGNEILGSQG